VHAKQSMRAADFDGTHSPSVSPLTSVEEVESSAMTMPTIGVVGLETMGARIAARLLSAGYEVHGYSGTPEPAEDLVAQGLILHERPQAAAGRADALFTLVADTEALRAVVDGSHGVLSGFRPDAVWVDLSTVDVAYSRELAERVDALGAKMLDAPVAGSVRSAEEGALAMFVGGDNDAYERVHPVLTHIASSITHVGRNGDGLALKLAVNLNLALQTLAFGEGVLLAESSGIEPSLAVKTLLASAMGSPMLRARGPLLLDRAEEPWLTIELLQRDLRLALDQGRDLEVPLPTTALANEIFSAARAQGRRGEDVIAVFDVLAQLAGREKPAA
jgi:3-hydroxyisobutyrate dehydrogenase-like beta-hydroxyacid dehydrogenase